MGWEKAHAEADKALNDSSYKMSGLAPYLDEATIQRIAKGEATIPTRARIVLYDGFLLVEGRGINLSHVREILIAPITAPFDMPGGKWTTVQIGYEILIVYKVDEYNVYRQYKLSEAYIQELNQYFRGVSDKYPINTEPIIGKALKDLKAVVEYEFQTIFNTIQR